MTLRPALALIAIVVAIASAAAGPAIAAGAVAAEAHPAWAALTPEQQTALAPLRNDWAGIDAARRQKWVEIANRFPKMQPAERQRLQARMTEWARMTPAERGRARLQFQETRTLSPEDRHARWEAYQALPDEQRRALAQKAKPAPRAASAGDARGTGVVAKRSTAAEKLPPAKSVAPTLVQARPGATTTLVSPRPASAPAPRVQPGQPKIAATERYVNPKTLLPQAGPQAARVRPGAASAPAARP